MFLVRHGRHSDFGERLTGRGDQAGLTAAGEAEVRAAAALLADEPVAAVFSSPRRRTQETARIIAAPHDLPVLVAPCLDEIDFGEWTGQPFADLDPQPEWQRWNAERSRGEAPGGETMAGAQARAVAFAIEAAARYEQPVVLVTHCDIIRALRCWADRRSLDHIFDYEAAPASITPLTILDEELVPA